MKHPLFKKLNDLLPKERGRFKYVWRGRTYEVWYTPGDFGVIGINATSPEGLRLLQSLATFLSKRKQGSAEDAVLEFQTEPHGSDEVVESLTQTSEDVHGGSEASGSVEDGASAGGAKTGSSLESTASQDAGNQGDESVTPSVNAAPDGGEKEGGPSTSGDGGADTTPGQGQQRPDAPARETEADGSQPAGDRADQECLPEDGRPSADGKDASGCHEGWQNLGGRSAEGFYSLFEALKERKTEEKGGGGGRQLDTSDDASASASMKIKEAIELLASGEDWSQKIDGFSKWHGKKLSRAITVEPHKLSGAKYDRPGDKVYFVVDTSGSVSH